MLKRRVITVYLPALEDEEPTCLSVKVSVFPLNKYKPQRVYVSFSTFCVFTSFQVFFNTSVNNGSN